MLRGPLERESLRLGVVQLPDAAHRLAWLAEHLDELTGSGIIYTLTVAAAEEATAFLRQRGFKVASYTGKTENADRLQAEIDLQENRVKALVATSALGMGYDKPDLGFVVHLGSPSSPIAYYQQVGRAGRGVAHADVLLLPGREDEAIWRYFADTAFPPETQVRQTLAALADAGRPLSVPALETAVDLRRSRLETMLKVLDVDGAVKRVKGGWAATGTEWVYDAERYTWVAKQRAAEQQAMRDYVSTSQCRMEFLRRRAGRRRRGALRPVRQLRGCLDRLLGLLRDVDRGDEGTGPPGCGGRAAPHVADRHGRAGRRPQGPHPGQGPGLHRACPGAALGHRLGQPSAPAARGERA